MTTSKTGKNATSTGANRASENENKSASEKNSAIESAEKATEQNIERDPSVATIEDNAALKHPQGGTTTRDDLTDLGVPMLPGSPKERAMPEDALGEGLKRGDYTGRMGDANYKPHETVKIENAEAGEAQFATVAQKPRTEQIGDAEGLKGGVETDPNFNAK